MGYLLGSWSWVIFGVFYDCQVCQPYDVPYTLDQVGIPVAGRVMLGGLRHAVLSRLSLRLKGPGRPPRVIEFEFVAEGVDYYYEVVSPHFGNRRSLCRLCDWCPGTWARSVASRSAAALGASTCPLLHHLHC